MFFAFIQQYTKFVNNSLAMVAWAQKDTNNENKLKELV